MKSHNVEFSLTLFSAKSKVLLVIHPRVFFSWLILAKRMIFLAHDFYLEYSNSKDWRCENIKFLCQTENTFIKFWKKFTSFLNSIPYFFLSMAMRIFSAHVTVKRKIVLLNFEKIY